MTGAIANSIKMPFEQANIYKTNYVASKGEIEKILIEDILCGLFLSLARAIEKIKIEGMDKKTALNELIEIDKILDKMEVILEKDDEDVSLKIKAAFNEFYEALDNLSCSLSIYVDDEAMANLGKIANGDYSDFEIYKP
jgi:hypothetical protein